MEGKGEGKGVVILREIDEKVGLIVRIAVALGMDIPKYALLLLLKPFTNFESLLSSGSLAKGS